MRRVILVVLLGLLTARAHAGPNAGGTLIAHDINLLASGTNETLPLCVQGAIPNYCSEADVELDGAGELGGDVAFFRVYAAFPDLSSPRLAGIAWGIDYGPAELVLVDTYNCGDFELPESGWPGPTLGNGVTWNTAQTEHLVPVYMFSAYTFGAPTLFSLRPHPQGGGYFGDDSVPSILDQIAGYGKLGFDQPGIRVCPSDLPLGACCRPDATCFLTTAEQCPPPFLWYGSDCTPNPCPLPPDQDGETLATAIPIPSLPFSASRTTCDHLDDYDEACPYGGSVAPDLVYRWQPPAAGAITVSLCGSSYNTKLYIYRDDAGDLVDCNDDEGCGYPNYTSRIPNLEVSPEHVYFIVIDGYGSSCGDYLLNVVESCALHCPEGAMLENEPPCQNGYMDHYNGGCNSDPPVFQPLPSMVEDCATLCGKSCSFEGFPDRDTDWYVVTGLGQAITVECTAEFYVDLFLIYNPDCADLQYDLTTSPACTTASLSRFIAAGESIWIMVRPYSISAVPESDYILHVCGIDGGAVPVERMSWGQLKSLYTQ